MASITQLPVINTTNTNNFTYKDAYGIFQSYDCNIPAQFLEKVTAKPDVCIFKIIIQLENNINLLPVIKTVIGSKGYYLTLTTKVNDVDFIWYNKNNYTFEIWGDTIEKCKNAETIIKTRIYNKMNKFTIQ